MNTARFLNPLISILMKAGKVGGKYLSRKQVAGKNGKMKWSYVYKPVSQRGAHEVTGSTFEKKTGLSKEEHKAAVEKALQGGNRVTLHILKDYPDLAGKYGMKLRLVNAEHTQNAVKEAKASKNKPDNKSMKDKPAQPKKELPEDDYYDLQDMDQNVEYGDTENENKFINKLVKLSEKYNVSEVIQNSVENGGILADDDLLAKLHKKMKS